MDRNFAAAVVWLDAGRAPAGRRCRLQSAGMLPTPRQASLHDERDGTALWQPEGLHLRFREMPLLPCQRLPGSLPPLCVKDSRSVLWRRSL